jgi:pimeloyl-ACP methyl ester carboxylesterase
MEKVTVGDIDMCYQVIGEGHPLVMIMGLTANMDWWDPELLESLSKRYRVLIFDNRGAGRTDAPPGEFTIKQFADDTAGLMDALGFDHAHVMGVSMGGMIAQELVLNYPERVDNLVLCVTFCGGQETVPASQEVLDKLIKRPPTPEEQAKQTLTLLFPEEWLETHKEYFDGFLEIYMRAPTTDENALRQFMACANFSDYDRLPLIDKPTLVACGAEDILIPPENSRIIADRIPGAKLVEYEGAGHGFINQYREEFTPVLVDFLG